MPDLIETRPFTIHPEIFAWPSFRLNSERVLWAYLVVLVALSLLLRTGMSMSWGLAILVAAGLVGVAFGFTFMKYKMRLQRLDARQVLGNCIVKLSDEEVRQDYSDSSFMAIKLFGVKSFREIGDFYFVSASPRHRIAVPKTAFDSPEESQQFAWRLREAAKARSETRGPK